MIVTMHGYEVQDVRWFDEKTHDCEITWIDDKGQRHSGVTHASCLKFDSNQPLLDALRELAQQIRGQ